ncbi:MAG: 4Fe-4S dicluster domain-containing protein [Chloroflexi bacterium]|nr:4Fe-4S dicluster domain-containing protein [Chloroflexota bacterium]
MSNNTDQDKRQPSLADSVRDLAEREDFEQILMEHDPRLAAVLKQRGMDRRSFLKMMGASLVLAGLQGCVTASAPGEAIIPYVRMPEEVIAGEALMFASSMVLSGFATGLLIETHEGRPHRIEGNPDHPASLGGSDLYTQGSILELYNPNRSTLTRGEGAVRSFREFRDALAAVLPGDGSGLRILTETISSPTLAAQWQAIQQRYPNARWHQYEPVNNDNEVAGMELAFGQAVRPVFTFENADVVVSLDANFLNGMPGSLAYARQFMDQRRIREGSDSMNRLYAVESTPTPTGSMADHRLALAASQVDSFTRALAGAFGISAGSGETTWDGAWFDALVADLEAHRGSSLIIAGPQQPPQVHALAAALNDALGNVGSTLTYIESPIVNPLVQAEDFASLVSDMQAGSVQVLLIIGGNPAFSAPADVAFVEALGSVPFSAHLSLYFDETSELCSWHIPQSHYIETWSDARAFNGAYSVVQPPIGPLYDRTRSPIQMFALLLDDFRSPHDIVRSTWEQAFAAVPNFEAFWNATVHDGVAPNTASPAASVSLSGAVASTVSSIAAAGSGTEIIFRPAPTLFDGRFAWNTWLQELPQPLTSISWDNAALMSPATAASLNVTEGNLVSLTVDGNSMEVPAFIIAGHPDDSVTVSLGYGRGLSAELDRRQNFNAYTIRPNGSPWIASGQVSRAGGRYDVTVIRSTSDGVNLDAMVRFGTLAEFVANPEFAKSKPKDVNLLPGFTYDENAWGMSIDLTACIGCNACILGCQTENNIPNVGKDAVENGREMYWLRVDAHQVSEGGQDQNYFQPVPCMHCENAPCEQVCPVQATVHDNQGLNQMVYNRCVGTRYCSANCPYTVRRFNYFDYIDPADIALEWRNPDVSVRVEGVMEKCTFCVQRINAARAISIQNNEAIPDGAIVPACAAACPTQAIVFGDVNKDGSQVAELKAQPHNYGMLEELNTFPRTTYLARLSNPNEALHDSEEGE